MLRRASLSGKTEVNSFLKYPQISRYADHGTFGHVQKVISRNIKDHWNLSET